MGRFIFAVYMSAFREGYASSENHSQQQVERLKAELADLRRIGDSRRRVYRDSQGQLVEIGRYAYRWTGTPDLKVGDEVDLPASWVQVAQGASHWTGTVTALGSTYTGQHSTILRRVTQE